MTIGILAVQGSVAEHRRALLGLDNVQVREVRYPADLDGLAGLIMPGGESTAMTRLLRFAGLWQPLRDKIAGGLPVWGTCAGMILLAKEIEGEQPHLSLMDITVQRNAYGRQLDSFTTTAIIPAINSEPLPLVFIRAPVITRLGEGVEILLEVKGNIVAARQNNMVVTSFHPELTTSQDFHRWFAAICQSGRHGH